MFTQWALRPDSGGPGKIVADLARFTKSRHWTTTARKFFFLASEDALLLSEFSVATPVRSIALAGSLRKVSFRRRWRQKSLTFTSQRASAFVLKRLAVADMAIRWSGIPKKSHAISALVIFPMPASEKNMAW